MKFNSARQVREVVDDMRTSDLARSQNRSRVNDTFNGNPPMTEAEALELHAGTNVNFLEPTAIAHRGRSTWNNAFLKTGNYCGVRLDRGPTWKRADYSARITQHWNKPLKRSRPYVDTLRATGAQVILHGIGPVWWCRPRFWRPEEISIEDILVPDGTRVSMDNLTHFAIYQQFTPGQLYRLTHGKKVEEGWSMKVVRRELRRAADSLMQSTGVSNRDLESPEKLSEFYKANSGMTDSSRVPTIDCWSFFFQDEEDERGRWYKKIIVDTPSADDNEFLYKPKRPFAGDLSEIIHVQFGDGANVAPFLFHSVRSLGFLLYAVTHLQNRLRCRFMDAIFEATLQYFSNVGESDRAMLQKVNLTHMGLIPEGLRMIPQAERWQVNEALVMAGLSQNRQLMSENAASFVQDVNDGTGKELTATEVMARLNQSNALVSSLLSMAYTYQKYQYMEIARRFCLEDSPDPDVRQFRADCLRDGIPKEYLNVECWDIEPERVMGSGNKTLELAQAKSLMEIRPQFDPPAQRIITRRYVLAITDDPDLALELVQDGKKEVSPAAHDAQLAFGALMNGGTVSVRHGMDHISYIEAMMESLLSLIEDIEVMQRGGELPSGQQIHGILKVHEHLIGHIQIVAQDKDNGARLKQYQDVLGRVANLVKGYGQRLDEQREAKANEGMEAEKAKIQMLMQESQVNMQLKQLESRQNLMLEAASLQAETARNGAKTAAEIRNLDLKTAATIEALDAKTAASVAATKAKAKASADAAKDKEESTAE